MYFYIYFLYISTCSHVKEELSKSQTCIYFYVVLLLKWTSVICMHDLIRSKKD